MYAKRGRELIDSNSCTLLGAYWTLFLLQDQCSGCNLMHQDWVIWTDKYEEENPCQCTYSRITIYDGTRSFEDFVEVPQVTPDKMVYGILVEAPVLASEMCSDVHIEQQFTFTPDGPGNSEALLPVAKRILHFMPIEKLGSMREYLPTVNLHYYLSETHEKTKKMEMYYTNLREHLEKYVEEQEHPVKYEAKENPHVGTKNKGPGRKK